MYEIWECVKEGAQEEWICLKGEAKDRWDEMGQINMTFTKRELLLGAVACAAAGMVLGLLCAPRKKTVIQAAPAVPEAPDDEAE